MIRIEIETLQAGQSRPYADRLYRAKISMYRIDGHGPNKGELFPRGFTRSRALELTRMFVHNYVDNGQWYEPKLDYAKPSPEVVSSKVLPPDEIFASSWEVQVRMAYCD